MKKGKASRCNCQNQKKKPSKKNSLKGDSKNLPVAFEGDETHPVKAKDVMSTFFGTANEDLQTYLINQIVHTFSGYASIDGCDNTKAVDFMKDAAAILFGIKPQDEIEGLLAVQMIAVHNMAMETMSRAILIGQTLKGKDASINHATKMLRTFLAQIDALKRYRTGGQQKMIIKHVYVNEGGQAIVGQLNQGGGKNKNYE